MGMSLKMRKSDGLVRFYLAVFTVVTAIAAVSVTAAAEETSPVNGNGASFSEYLSEVDENVYLAGTLDLDALRNVKDGPIQIIDLRTASEGTEEEAAAAAALGLDYANIPVSSATVDPVQVDALRAALAGVDPEALVVVHCASGNRAGLLWGAVQLADGVPLDTVRAEVSPVLTKQPVIDGLDAYAKTVDAGL